MRSLHVRGLNWDNARSYCLSYGGDLVSVSNKSEMDFINSHKSNAGREYFWIGLNDRRKENVFVWSDGTPYNKSIYSNWYPNEPNNMGDEDCVDLIPTQWNDNSCVKEKSYICERRKGEIIVLILAKYIRSSIMTVAMLVILMTMVIKEKKFFVLFFLVVVVIVIGPSGVQFRE